MDKEYTVYCVDYDSQWKTEHHEFYSYNQARIFVEDNFIKYNDKNFDFYIEHRKIEYLHRNPII